MGALRSFQRSRLAVILRQPACALDAYMQFAEEAFGNEGYLEGPWLSRLLVAGRVGVAGKVVWPRGECSAGLLV